MMPGREARLCVCGRRGCNQDLVSLPVQTAQQREQLGAWCKLKRKINVLKQPMISIRHFPVARVHVVGASKERKFDWKLADLQLPARFASEHKNADYLVRPAAFNQRRLCGCKQAWCERAAIRAYNNTGQLPVALKWPYKRELQEEYLRRVGVTHEEDIK